ncbi:MAG: hypothetical protein JO023_27615, partial [Chloroflexi bacterium]|nr:hypothetical protein [Chloroflexota bacterium]
QAVSTTVQLQAGQARNPATQQARIDARETPTAGPLPTVDAEVAAEVVAAYKHYWDVRAEALLNLDPAHLPEVSADPHLTVLQNGIEQLSNEGHAIRTDVQLNFKLLSATSSSAIIVDDFVDNSVYVNPETKEPITDDDETNSLRNESNVEFKMQKFDDTWKVVDSAHAP